MELRGGGGSWRGDADLEIGDPGLRGGLGRTFAEVFPIFADVGGNDFAQGFRAEGVGIFFLGDLDGEQESLREIGERGGGARLDDTTGDCGEKAAQGGGQVAGRDVITRQEEKEIAAELVSGLGLRVLASMEATEERMAGLERSAAAAAVGESESTEPNAVFGLDRGHGSPP